MTIMGKTFSIKFSHSGNFDKTTKFIVETTKKVKKHDLKKYGEAGVKELERCTPKKTGKTSKSWYYNIEKTQTGSRINFCNKNIQNGVPIAIILQYGHGLKGGGWVEGYDYINPALKTVFESLANDAWREVVD